MKLRNFRTAWLLASALALLTPAWSQVCSTQATRGTYSATCTGYLSPAAGAPQSPASLIGVCKADPQGVFNCTSKVSLGGAILDQTVIGTAVVNSDCTGTISYNQKINGNPVPNLNIVFHVLDDGKELRGMAVDAGTTLSCNLRLMSR